MEDVAWHEACPRRINMPVTLRILLVREEPLRHDEVQVILGARHRHIEKPAFFLDFCRRCGIRRKADTDSDGRRTAIR